MICAVYSVVNITISPGAVVEGGQFSIQCTYDVPLYYLIIRRAGMNDKIKAVEYLKEANRTAVPQDSKGQSHILPWQQNLDCKEC